MKAESGSWIYILLSIVFLVLSAIGNKNKKRATTSTQPLGDDDYDTRTTDTSERNWPRSLEDVLNEMIDTPKRQEVAQEKQTSWSRDVLENSRSSYETIEEEAQSLETIDSDIFTYESTFEPIKMQNPVEYQPLAQSVAQAAPLTKDVEEVYEPAFADFDLRQGIIYAEILNRKYF